MSDYGLFFDSRNGDRKYNASSMEEWLKPFFVSGVFQSQLQVTATTGMTVSLAAGYCNILGKVRCFDEAQTFTLQPASGTTDRVDTIVIERNDGDRQITTKMITGTPGSGATARVWNTSSGVYQLVVAEIAVNHGTTAITQSMITDTRMDSSKCGYVCATVTEIDFTQISAQFDAYFDEFKEDSLEDYTEWSTQTKADFEEWMETEEGAFDTWFDHMKGQLSTDAAGHLQEEIDDQEQRLADIEEMVTNNLYTAAIKDDDGYIVTDDDDTIILGEWSYKEV